MKKLTFLAIGALMLFGFATGADYARAADPLPVTNVIGTENARVLQQSLDVLGATLNQLDEQIDSNQPLANAAGTNEDLVAIHGELIALRSTLASLEDSARALAENKTPAQAPVTAQAPQPQILTVAPLTDIEMQSAISPLPITTDQDNAIVSETLAGSLKNYLWPMLLVLAVAAGIFFLRKKKVAEPVRDHDPDDAEMFSSLPTITDY